jgi:hypothetical protein
MDRLLAFVVVFLIPLIPAVFFRSAVGKQIARAAGSVGGIKFEIGGAGATYVICLALAYVGYGKIVTSDQYQVSDTSHDQVIGTAAAVSNDPLAAQPVRFAQDNWVITFQSIDDSIVGSQSDHSELVEQLIVFRNESKEKLSTFILPGYKFDGNTVEFEGLARLLPGSVVDADLIAFRGNPQLNGLDSAQVLERIRSLVKELASSGSEVGYFKDMDGKPVSDPKRSQRLLLGGNGTLVHGDPIGVDPGGSIAAVLRLKVHRDETTVQPGRLDHLGTMISYPTRLLYLMQSNTAQDIRIAETTSSVEITNKDGTKSSLKDDKKFKRHKDNLIYTDWLVDVATKPSIQWVWEKADYAAIK